MLKWIMRILKVQCVRGESGDEQENNDKETKKGLVENTSNKRIQNETTKKNRMKNINVQQCTSQKASRQRAVVSKRTDNRTDKWISYYRSPPLKGTDVFLKSYPLSGISLNKPHFLTDSHCKIGDVFLQKKFLPHDTIKTTIRLKKTFFKHI